MGITKKQYSDLDDAFQYFNKHLFDNKLPDCLITFQHHKSFGGYHWNEKFVSRYDNKKISEIALNPDKFEDRSDLDILAILAHEMVHVQQHLIGEPPRKGYHDKGFAILMNEIGLQASATGEPGGKATGQRMSHYILEGGKFEKVANAFLLSGEKFQWNSVVESKETKERKKTREKWTCPKCLQEHAWARKTAKIACGVCMVPMVIEESE